MPLPPAASLLPADEFAPEKEVVYENTYITKPEGYGPARAPSFYFLVQKCGKLARAFV